MPIQTDLFEEPHIQIKDNKILEKVANHLLMILQNHQELLDGDTVGEIDRHLCVEFWMDEGLNNIIPSDKREDFLKFMLKATEADLITRARRYLLEKDLIRISAKAIRDSELKRAQITKAMK